MPLISIAKIPGFMEWRLAARQCLSLGLHPREIQWRPPELAALPSLFDGDDLTVQPEMMGGIVSNPVPKAFIQSAELAACSRDADRFSLLYRLLWRLVHENKQILHYETDPDILHLNRLVKSVNRDAYKMTAFLRFRETLRDGEPHFVGWYEPEHFTLDLALPFFQERFLNMRWSILTPYRSAHWDGHCLEIDDHGDRALYPDQDPVEAYWLNYYKNTFNPARLKQKAMLSQMPKKYWKNMPETKLIETLIRESSASVNKMLHPT